MTESGFNPVKEIGYAMADFSNALTVSDARRRKIS
jgi:hypothetical protein